MSWTPKDRDAARQIFRYLYARDPDQEADLIIGFGHFDMKIPAHCAQLYEKGYAKKILLTGGRGAGTADLEVPEGIAFRNWLRENNKGVAQRDLLVESESTNTAENILFSEKLLRSQNGGLGFGAGIHAVLAVASPYRQKRVSLTMKQLFPRVHLINSPPETSFEEEIRIFARRKQNLISLLTGEVRRLREYPAKGFIAEEQIPDAVLKAYELLKGG